MSASAQFPTIPADWSQETARVLKDQIQVRLWRSPKPQSGRFLFLVHGQGEQSDRYEHFPFYLNGHIDAIGVLDLPGHGKSSGIRGHINNFDQYSEAVLEAFQWTHRTSGKIEAHWLGHSLGGLITLRTLLKKQDLPLASVCVSAPLLGLALAVPPVKKTFALLTEPILGSLPLANEINPADLSHDETVQLAYQTNPLNHNKVSPRFFVRMMREMELLKAPIDQFAYPLMMLVPLGDQIVSWKASYQFFERLKMKAGIKKELQAFPEFKHESFNEIEKDRAFLALENWIIKNSRK